MKVKREGGKKRTKKENKNMLGMSRGFNKSIKGSWLFMEFAMNVVRTKVSGQKRQYFYIIFLAVRDLDGEQCHIWPLINILLVP